MNANDQLQTVEIEPEGQAAASIIWLHGLGADGHDFEPVVEELGLAPPVRFVFPHAPFRPVTVNGGLSMRAWYDIVSLDDTKAEDEAGILASASAVERLVSKELARGVPALRIVLAGFSQGGAMALHVALRYRRRLAGVLALSTYLPLAETLSRQKSAENAGLEIFMAHGLMDPLVPLALAERTKRLLEEEGYGVSWHRYPVDHGVCPQEIHDIGAWLNRLLVSNGSGPP